MMTARTLQGERWSRSPWRLAMWFVIAGLLLLPVVAMRFTKEVNWTITDFAFAGALLIGAGLLYEVAARRAPTPLRRLLFGGAILAVVLLVWAQGAVGIL